MIGSFETELVMEARIEQWRRETRPAIERESAVEQELAGRTPGTRRSWPMLVGRLIGRPAVSGASDGRPGAGAPAPTA